jgi:HlyD family secretion protein
MKNKKVLFIVLGVLLVAAVVAANVMRGAGGKTTSVQFANVKREAVTAEVRAPGKIEPRTLVNVSADVAGKVVRLAVKEGDRVKRGDLMLQLDDTQYRSAFDQARAALSSAEARLRDAEALLRVAENNYQRQRSLFDDRLLSQAEWDQATSAIESARVAAHTAREEVARSRAARSAAADNLSKCRFVAPFDGVVSALYVEEGEIVVIGTMNNPGTQIMTVSDLSRMLVRADVDETDVVDVRLGQKATITVDAFPDTTFAGTIVEIGNTAKRTSASAVEGQTNFEVEVVFDETVPQIRPGMTADVEIETATHANTLGVPIQAVVVRTARELAEGSKKGRGRRGADAVAAASDSVEKAKDAEITGVFVGRDGAAAFVPVETGLASETTIEIFGDVVEGDRVVSGPYKALRELKPGTKLKSSENRPNRPGK